MAFATDIVSVLFALVYKKIHIVTDFHFCIFAHRIPHDAGTSESSLIKEPNLVACMCRTHTCKDFPHNNLLVPSAGRGGALTLGVDCPI
jgi:hypothetical protein